MSCDHTWTRGREGEPSGCGWCIDCGVKVYAVEERECRGCAHHVRLIDGSICKKHLMAITPTMHVTYSVFIGTCFEEKETN
jgi:hypothetical protein